MCPHVSEIAAGVSHRFLQNIILTANLLVWSLFYISIRGPWRRTYHFRRNVATNWPLRWLTRTILQAWGQYFNDIMIIAYIIRKPFQQLFHLRNM